MAFDLASIGNSRRKMPPRMVLYGPHGIGKTTFAAQAPKPILLATEEGQHFVDVQSFGDVAEKVSDIYDAIRVLIKEEHDYKTFIIDSIDWAEKLVHENVAKKWNEASVGSIDYGKGYAESANIMMNILNGLDTLWRKRGMGIILISHATISRVKDPLVGEYDRFAPSLHSKVVDKLQEWADLVGFARLETIVDTEKGAFGQEAKKVTGERRLLHFKSSNAFEAKNRAGLARTTLPLSWQAFQDEYTKAINKNEEEKKEESDNG